MLRAALWLAASALVGPASAIDLLRYTIRFDPFEVELAMPDGSKQKKSLPRQATYFFHRANMRWPVPDGAAEQRVRCEFRWEGFPADWKLVSSWSIGKREETVETTLRQLRKAMFAGGDLRIAPARSGLILVTRGDWGFADETWLRLMDSVASAHNRVWRDRGVAGHKLFVFPSTQSWNGEGRTNSLVMEGSPDTYQRTDVSRLLAHELFHEWNGRRLDFSDDETMYWFTEGFTEYYAVMGVWRAGLWKFSEVLEHFNRMARAYYGSPARNLTAERMVASRQANISANQLPYQQGYLLAAHWNRPGNTLDLALRNLMASNGSPLSNVRVARSLGSIGVADAAGEIQRFVARGETIQLRGGLWGPCAEETSSEVRTFDPGFDWTASMRTKVITGAKPGSNAWQAGVRDGQKWASLDVVVGDATYQAEIELEDEAGRRRVRYFPASTETLMVPQYRPVGQTCDAETMTGAGIGR